MKKIIGIILVLILLVSVFFIGKRYGSAEGAVPEEAAKRNLRLSVTLSNGAGFTDVALEEGNYQRISYLDVTDVTIDIGGTEMALEDALRGGVVSVDELVAWARQDAAQGFCREAAKSKNGLTEFTYYYSDSNFNLRHIYDLYETPDGGQHLITDFLIYGGWCQPHFYPRDGETGETIDYEDWGLTFEVSEADASGIRIKCSQSGGQQMGALNAGTHLLYRKDPNAPDLVQVEPLNPEALPGIFAGLDRWNPEPDAFLTMGGTKELSLDFAGLYGRLPAGAYVLSLEIVDWYDPEQVPSLTRNYYDSQWYEIEFTVTDA